MVDIESNIIPRYLKWMSNLILFDCGSLCCRIGCGVTETGLNHCAPARYPVFESSKRLLVSYLFRMQLFNCKFTEEINQMKNYTLDLVRIPSRPLRSRQIHDVVGLNVLMIDVVKKEPVDRRGQTFCLGVNLFFAVRMILFLGVRVNFEICLLLIIILRRNFFSTISLT